MFYDSISYFVGSANAKLADDMRNWKKRGPASSSHVEAKPIDFQLVKISCKKENNVQPSGEMSKQAKLVEKIVNFVKFKWIFRLILFVIILAVMSFTIFRLVEFILVKYRHRNQFGHNYYHRMRRDLSMYDFNYLNEWSGEKIATILELESIDHVDENKLDYLRKTMKIRCIRIRNVDPNDQRLNAIIQKAQEKSIKVVLDLYMSGMPMKKSQTNAGIYLNVNDSILTPTQNFVYLDYDSPITQQRVVEQAAGLIKSIGVDGFYLTDLHDLKYKNSTQFERFLIRLKRVFKSKQCILIGLNNGLTSNKLLDLNHVILNKTLILESLVQKSINPFENYFKFENKNYIWSLESSDQAGKLSDLIKMYLMIYSLPGITMISRLSSNRTQLSDFIAMMNEKIKPKLNDDPEYVAKKLKSQSTSTTSTQKPRGPEPYKNSYFSLTNSYLKDDYLNFNLTAQKLFIITRQNNQRFNVVKHHSLLSIKLYRNVIFIINLSNDESGDEIFLDKLFKLPVGNNANLKESYQTYAALMPLHIMFDSTNTLPEYVDFNAPNFEPFHVLRPNQSLVLEY